MRPAAIIERLDLRRPIYQKTAAYGHFGRPDPDFTWERTDHADALRKAAKPPRSRSGVGVRVCTVSRPDVPALDREFDYLVPDALGDLGARSGRSCASRSRPARPRAGWSRTTSRPRPTRAGCCRSRRSSARARRRAARPVRAGPRWRWAGPRVAPAPRRVAAERGARRLARRAPVPVAEPRAPPVELLGVAAGGRPARPRRRADRGRRVDARDRGRHAAGSARCASASSATATACSSCGRTEPDASAPGPGPRPAPAACVRGRRSGRGVGAGAGPRRDHRARRGRRGAAGGADARRGTGATSRSSGPGASARPLTLVAPLRRSRPTRDRRGGDPAGAADRARRVADRRGRRPAGGAARHRAAHRALATRAAPAVDRGERAVCLLNRRGRARLLACLRCCNELARCERCGAFVEETGAGTCCVRRAAASRRPMICLHCHATQLKGAAARGASACARRSPRCCPGPRSSRSTPRPTTARRARSFIGTEAVLHRLPPGRRCCSPRSSTSTRSCSRPRTAPRAGARAAGAGGAPRRRRAPAAVDCSSRPGCRTTRWSRSALDGDPTPCSRPSARGARCSATRRSARWPR